MAKNTLKTYLSLERCQPFMRALYFIILSIALIATGCKKNTKSEDMAIDYTDDILIDSLLTLDADSQNDLGTMTEYGFVYYVTEKSPQFGDSDDTDSLFSYLVQNTNYPLSAVREQIEGRVFISFILDETGRVMDPEILRGLQRDIDNECIRVIQNMPNWKPGEIQGKPVRVKYVLPIAFRLNPDPKKVHRYVTPDNLFDELIEYTLYPNPASSYINIDISSAAYEFKYRLVDSNGNVLKSGNIDSNNYKIDIHDISNGLYIFQLMSNDKRLLGSKRLLKE